MYIMNWMRFRTFFDGFTAKEAAVSFFEDAGIVYGLVVAENSQNVAYLPVAVL